MKAEARKGVDRIAEAFAECPRRAALMPYMMGGFPDMKSSQRIGETYLEAGADLIELGVPYSDPLADGPVIQSADQVALRSGATVEGVLELADPLASKVPVVIMAYVNTVLAYGRERLVERLATGGIAGLIVPDQPVEEAGKLLEACDRSGVALVQLAAPTSTDGRLEAISKASRGFIYAVSVTGVTGERGELPSGLADFIERLRGHSSLPIAVGFGIGTPGQAAEVAEMADGVIIGSRLVREVSDADSTEQGARSAGKLLSEIAQALKA